jgi:hypothetical protein
MDFLIKPRINQFNNSIGFATDSLNALAQEQYNDKFGFYQSNFGVYNYMRLNTNLKYRVHYPQGTPFMWQPHNSCAWTPLGNLTMGEVEIEPCRAKINEQFCYDEFMESLFKDFLRNNTGEAVISLSEAGREAADALVRTIVKNATIGARMTLTGGQLYPNDIEFVEGASSTITQAFEKTVNTCKGWIKLLIDTAAADSDAEQVDGDFIKAADISSDGKEWLGDNRDAVDLYDEIFDGAKQELRDAIIEGGFGGFGQLFYPMFLVSPSIYRAVDTAWKEQKQSAMMNMPRIERRVFDFVAEPGGFSRPLYAYFIDDTVVVQVNEISKFDRMVTGTSHFAYLTISGVIQLGGSFANIPTLNESEVAVLTQLSTDVEDYMTFKFLAHSLLATAINDTDYIAGNYEYALPA